MWRIYLFIIKTIPSTPLQRLQELHLQHNSIEVLADQAFVGLSSLALLDLSRNNLHTIGPVSLQPLVSLQVLRITGRRHLKGRLLNWILLLPWIWIIVKICDHITCFLYLLYLFHISGKETMETFNKRDGQQIKKKYFFYWGVFLSLCYTAIEVQPLPKQRNKVTSVLQRKGKYL